MIQSRPFRQFLLQFFFARQIKLVFPGVDVRVFGQSDFYQCLVFLLAQHNADGGRFGIGFDVAVKVVDVHLHLAQILVRELADFEVDQHIAAQQAVVEHQVYKEVAVVKAEALLARLKQRALCPAPAKNVRSG